MFKKGFDFMFKIFQVFLPFLYIFFAVLLVFSFLCVIWFFVFKYRDKMKFQPSGIVKYKRSSIWKQLFYELPQRYVLDMFQREPHFFRPKGIHMFCGEQGSGKTIAAVEMMLRLQKQYPMCKSITNFGLSSETDPLDDWHQLLDYTNGHQGVVVGIDEIQNWFMSGLNKLPIEMLEVATQNRKNNRIICCTSQVFTRVNKGLREQVSMVYNPHTVLGCFTIVIKRKPVFDSEGNVTSMKYKGMYSFVHTEELRNAYDTYKVIHTLSREGFKDQASAPVTNVYVATPGKKR